MIDSTKNTQNKKSDKLYNNYWFLTGAAVILFAFVFLFAVNKRKQQKGLVTEKENSVKSSVVAAVTEIPLNPLIETEKSMAENDVANFYPVLSNELRKYLSHKLKVPYQDINKKKINELLDKSNVGVGTTLILTSLLGEIELNLYAPPSSATYMQAVYEKAAEVISLLDKQC